MIPVAAQVAATNNPIRQIVDKIKMPAEDPSKPTIRLSIGDPTIYGNLPPPAVVQERMPAILKNALHNGYLPSTGLLEAREAIAEREGVTAQDVVIGSGCSHALLMSLRTLCDSGDNVLLPSPGFSLYTTLCAYLGIEARYYSLKPEQRWQVDLQELETLVDGRTRAILVNNPSNPCGSNFSREHILDILALAEKHSLPIIADEIYANMVFEGVFHSVASLSERVPVLTCGGLAKRYMMPGWRVGWVVVHDRQGRFEKVRDGLQRVSTTILGACSIAQAMVAPLLRDAPQEFYERSMSTLREQADAFISGMKEVPGLSVILPEGAMYCMVGIDLDAFDDSITDDVTFSNALLEEARVFVLPGSCFRMPNYFRVVFLPPKDKLHEATRRLANFCQAHRKK